MISRYILFALLIFLSETSTVHANKSYEKQKERAYKKLDNRARKRETKAMKKQKKRTVRVRNLSTR